MAEKDKSNLYLLSIVGIVAVVGIVVLVLNSGTVSVNDDLTGQTVASRAKTTEAKATTEIATATKTKTATTPKIGNRVKTIEEIKKIQKAWIKLRSIVWFATEYNEEEDRVTISSIVSTISLNNHCSTEYYSYGTDTTCTRKSRGDAYLNLDPDLAHRDIGWIWFNVCCESGKSFVTGDIPPSGGTEETCGDEYSYESGSEFTVGTCTYHCSSSDQSGGAYERLYSGAATTSSGLTKCLGDAYNQHNTCWNEGAADYNQCVQDCYAKCTVEEATSGSGMQACYDAATRSTDRCDTEYDDTIMDCNTEYQDAGCEL